MAKRIVKRQVLNALHARNERERTRLNQVNGIAPAAWSAAANDAGNLLIDSVDIARLADEYGTPLHVVNRSRLLADYQQFHHSFSSLYPNVAIGYSYKTNPLPGVLRVLHEAGALAEVISHFELWLAIRLAVPADRIIFNGPGKTRDAIALAVDHSISMINIDSVDEIDEIARAARNVRRTQQVGVRVITSVGWSAQFGLSIASGAAFEAFRRIATHPELGAAGLHFHLGTGIRDVAIYLQAVREMLEFAQRLRSELGVRITQLDLGGGFGVPTVRPYTGWDFRLIQNGLPPAPTDPSAAAQPAQYAQAIVELVRQHFRDGVDPLPTIVFEPGRAITSSAQCLVLRVLAVKDQRHVILDGGKNIAMPTGYEAHELLAVNGVAEQRSHRYSFYGPLCHPGDLLFQAKTFRMLKPGDLVAIMDAGAYFIPNQMNFSNPRPAAVMIDASHCVPLRDRESFEGIVQLDRLHSAELRGGTYRELGTQPAAPVRVDRS